ncbi:5645_t:CDS:2, partial [Funneliformis mosseae]
NGIWYRISHVGKNRLNKFMQNIGRETQIDISVELLSNHSGCKTTTQVLQDEEIPEQAIMQLTGHKSVQEVQTYKTINEEQQFNTLKTLINITDASYLKDFFCKTNTSEWTCENAVEYYNKYISPNENLKKFSTVSTLSSNSEIESHFYEAKEGNRDMAKLEHGKSTGYERKVRANLDSQGVAKLEHGKSTGHERKVRAHLDCLRWQAGTRKHWTSDVKKSDRNDKTIQNHLNEHKVIRSTLAEHITRKRPAEEAEEASPIITSPNLRDHTQYEQDRPRTPENNLQGEMVLRKKKKVRYTESSSSDSDGYVEGSKYKNARPNRYAREEDNSRESTPCPTTQTIANTLIITLNKPIITSATFNQYSVHEIERTLKTRNKLVLKGLILKKLEAIFQSDYSEIFSKIIEETATEKDNETTEESRFLFFIRHTLLDFVAMFKYLTPNVLDGDMKERSYIVECLSPILRAFRNAFPGIKYEWIEKDVESIKK